MNRPQVRVLLAAALLAGGLVLTPGASLAAPPPAGSARNVDLTPPSTPGRLIPLPTPFGEFGFGWAPSTDDRGVVRYDVFFGQQKIADTTGTSFIQSAPAPTQGVYAVRAVDAAGNLSPFSTYPIGFPADTVPPSTPANLRLAAARGYFTASWNPSTDNLTVAGYEVTVNGVVTRTGATKLRFPFSSPGVYTVRVRAFDGAGNFSAASTISIAVDPPPPARISA
jgi:chitinase